MATLSPQASPDAPDGQAPGLCSKPPAQLCRRACQAGEVSDFELGARARANNHVRGVEVVSAGIVAHGARARSAWFC